jgi:hypothetical protein
MLSPMRKNMIRAVAVAAAATLALVPAGCSSTSQKCKGNSCNVTVKGDDNVKATVLGMKWEFDDLLDDSIEVENKKGEKLMKEGETATVGGFTVVVKDADKGSAKLVISK